MNHNDAAARTAAYLETFLEKEGYLLLKTEYVTEDGIHYLRAYIDLTEEEKEKRKRLIQEKKNFEENCSEEEPGNQEFNGCDLDEEEQEPEPGIGTNDCALVSRRLSKWLDKEDFIPEEYMLEVCSRGYLNVPNMTENEEK